MDKELNEMSFEDLVRKGVEIEVDSFMAGEKIRDRVYRIMELAVRWRYEKSQTEKTK